MVNGAIFSLGSTLSTLGNLPRDSIPRLSRRLSHSAASCTYCINDLDLKTREIPYAPYCITAPESLLHGALHGIFIGGEE